MRLQTHNAANITISSSSSTHRTLPTPCIRYALERGAQHIAFVYDGLLVLNVSLAAYADVKLWEVGGFCSFQLMQTAWCILVLF